MLSNGRACTSVRLLLHFKGYKLLFETWAKLLDLHSVNLIAECAQSDLGLNIHATDAFEKHGKHGPVNQDSDDSRHFLLWTPQISWTVSKRTWEWGCGLHVSTAVLLVN